MAERKRRGPSRRSYIGPLAFLATGAVASAVLWHVLSGVPSGTGHERIDAADRQALDGVLRRHATGH